MVKLKQGLVHIYTGNGKGKTTAAIGIAIRAAGAGLRVGIFQFLKDGSFNSAEKEVFKRLTPGIEFMRFKETHPLFCKKTCKAENALDIAKLKASIYRDFNKVKSEVKKKKYDLAVLDEIINAASQGFIDERELIGFIRSKPKNMELVFTGRNAGRALVEMADYVTEMKELKHPHRKGICARRGIEF